MATKINAEQAARLKAFQKRVDAGEKLAGEEARSFYNLQQVKSGKPTLSKTAYTEKFPSSTNAGTQDPNSDGKATQFGQDPKLDPQPETPVLLGKDGKISKVAQSGALDVWPPTQATAANANAASATAASANAASATAASANVASQDTTLSGQARNSQVGLANQLQAQANGTAPSLAGLQLQAALDANQKSNLSLARSSNYANPAVGMRAAIQANAQQGQASAMQAAQARIAEVNAGQLALAQVLAQQRGADIGIEQGNQAAINNAFLANAGFQQQTGLANADMQQQAALTNAGFQQQTALTNAGALNNQVQFAAQLNAQNNQFNASQVNQQTGQQAGLNASIQNTGTQATASQNNAKTAAGAQVQSAGIYADASKYAADNSLQAATQNTLIENDNQSPGAQTY